MTISSPPCPRNDANPGPSLSRNVEYSDGRVAKNSFACAITSSALSLVVTSCNVSCELLMVSSNGYFQRERRTRVGRHEPNVTVQQLRQALGQREAKARAAIGARHCSIDLAKLLEHQSARGVRNADPSVPDAVDDLAFRQHYGDGNFAVFRELERVFDQRLER